MWERGLKYQTKQQAPTKSRSFPLWERGLKLGEMMYIPVVAIVVPLVGTWIEIQEAYRQLQRMGSFPLWERGLK